MFCQKVLVFMGCSFYAASELNNAKGYFMKITKHAVVSIHYTLTDDEGTVIDSSQNGDPLTYMHGVGQLIPGLESELEGKAQGENLETRIDPENGYGTRDDNLVREVPKAQFEADGELHVGMQFQANSPEGAMIFTITKVEGEQVTIDGNHPLAGIHLNFAVSVQGVREATEQELEHGHAHGEEGHDHDH